MLVSESCRYYVLRVAKGRLAVSVWETTKNSQKSVGQPDSLTTQDFPCTLCYVVRN